MGGYIYIWRYVVHPDKLNEFLHVYGPDGDWVRLFSGAAGYLGTELLRDRERDNCYITIDRWRSVEEFRLFRKAHFTEFEALDIKCEEYTSVEEEVGKFTDDVSG